MFKPLLIDLIKNAINRFLKRSGRAKNKCSSLMTHLATFSQTPFISGSHKNAARRGNFDCVDF